MAAYAAVVSLMDIFHKLEHHHHPSSPISLDKKQVESLTQITMFFQEFLEGYKSPFADGDEADPLEMRITDAVYTVEDVIESHILNQIRLAVLVLYGALVKMIKDMDLIAALKEGKLLRHSTDSSPTPQHMYMTLLDVIADIESIEERVKKNMDVIFTSKNQVKASADSSTYADLYMIVVKVTGHLDLIMTEVMEIFAFKDQLRRQMADLNETQEDFRKGMDLNLIKKELMEIFAEGQHLSTYAHLYQTQEDFRKNMDLDLIKKELMEIAAVKDQLLQRQVSASANVHESLQKVIEDMDLIKKEVMEIIPLKDQRQVSESGGSSISLKRSTSSISRLNNTNMVGFDDVMLLLMEKLIYGQLGRNVIPIVGMGGIGKTTLANNVYEKPFVSQHFDICAWVTISQQYNTKELLCDILFQTDKHQDDKQRLNQMREDEIGLAVHKCLSYRRYLIVLDDMWSVEAWEKIQIYFPDNSNGSRIMVTTRLSNLGSQLDNNNCLEMKFIDAEGSWNMFSKIVFGVDNCPLELEKVGKKIVESCRGLPLSIVVMGGLLEKLERTEECWESIGRSITSLVNSENDKHCLKILKLSYNHLPIYLKPCFLYLGMFQEAGILVSTVIKLWTSEGFLKPISGKCLDTIAKEYLQELVDRNLIIVTKFGKTGKMKYFKLHDLGRDICLREAEKERFYFVVGQHSPQGARSQKRVVIPRSTLEEKSVEAMNARPYTRTCISYCEDVQLGKLLELANLRFLVCRYRGKFVQLPTSINLHLSLQTIIVHSPLFTATIDAPVEIWNMPQLRHVCCWFGAMCLPDLPNGNIVIMENLHTLKGVSNFKCDGTMARRIPNIKKLGLIYYGKAMVESCDDDDESFDDKYFLHNMECLQLESLSCENRGTSDLFRKLTLPHSLRSLNLDSGVNGTESILEKGKYITRS